MLTASCGMYLKSEETVHSECIVELMTWLLTKAFW